MASISLRHVEKRYGDVPVLFDCNLEIQDREFMVLVGPSGSGKTTLLRIICGLEHITAGDLMFDDQRMNDVDVGDRDIAMVFQNYGLYPHMSVYDNMAFGLRRRRMPKDEIDQRVNDAAGMLNIANYLQRRPRQLSGGQRQRVALGRAIVRDPAVFLLDEPLSNLDAHLRVQMRTEILRVHRAVGATAVYVTHDQVEALTMGDRITVMADGRIQQVGTPEELYDSPRNRFVASFIGTPSMGFLECDVKRGETGLRLEAASTAIALGNDIAQRIPAALQKVTVGIRPERLVLCAPDVAEVSAVNIRAQVEAVEMIGAEQHVHVKSDDGALVARVPREQRLKDGDAVALSANTGHLHLFDPNTGLAL
ncbi:MAG TPA: sn-glycerol-3-phosphate ABC transporter ATP-binding protein UgpC [Devosia sp.]|nr:sn-glycerol-3-phosphate ABC transporter ATP-binding protein UgpC [Devosia sp.]